MILSEKERAITHSGFPSRAASLLLKSGLEKNLDLTERVAASLFVAGLYDKAGELYEKIGTKDKAMDSYKKGKVYRAAVELARSAYPQEVVKLEEQWGDYLVSIKQLDASINHYIESGNTSKAIDAAIGAKQVIITCIYSSSSGKRQSPSLIQFKIRKQ